MATIRSSTLVESLVKKLEKTDEKQTDGYDGKYNSFTSEGSVSLFSKPEHETPIEILKDTGATQSILLEGILPLSDQSSMGAKVLIQGVDCGEIIMVPLHYVNLKYDIVTGTVTVGLYIQYQEFLYYWEMTWQVVIKFGQIQL